MAFVTEYFVKYSTVDAILEDHAVRVVYDDGEGEPLNIPQMIDQKLVFDIFVKSNVLHTADDNRLKDRAVLIFERLKYLLTRQTYVCNLRIRAERDYGLGSRTIGYRRYRAVFSFIKTY